MRGACGPSAMQGRMAHRVISLPRSNCVGFGVKRHRVRSVKRPGHPVPDREHAVDDPAVAAEQPAR